MADETDRRLYQVEHDLRGLPPPQLASVQFPLARVIAMLSTVPDGSSPLADLDQDSPYDTR